MTKLHQENNVTLMKQWFQAVKYNNTKIIEQFLKKGFDIETHNKTERTALHVAAKHNSINVAILLIKHNARIEAKMCDEGTPLLDAVAYGHVEMTLFLLKSGANISAKDEIKWGVMHWITNENQLKLIDALNIQISALIPKLIRVKPSNGIAPLHIVRSAAMTKKLIALGAPIEDETSENGNTPLIEATEKNQLEVVICLVRHGANILHANHDNKTAFDIAIEMRHQEINAFFGETLFKQNNPKRNKTSYNENMTAALQMREEGIHKHHIEFHASLRMDLFFFTLIAYYNSKLTIGIEKTNRQHGQGAKKTNTTACHSAILTSLWDTTKKHAGHEYSTRNAPTITSYRTGILNGTHFYESLNLTVELDESVNYFDTHHIEGRTETNQKMRACALNILNTVSSGKSNPIEGMNKFLNKFNEHLLAVKDGYFKHKELKTSPRDTRPKIFDAQYKGSFFNTCGFKSARKDRNVIELKEDYIQAQLPLTKKERIKLREDPGFFSIEDKEKIYQNAFLRVKKDMNLPVQYQQTLYEGVRKG